MLAVVAYDPAALPSDQAGREVRVLARFAHRHEVVLACVGRSAGQAIRLLAALGEAMPRFRFVALVAEPGATRPVDVLVVAGLLDDGAVPAVLAFDDAAGPVPVVPLASRIAADVRADVVLRLAHGADGVTLQPTGWVPGRPVAA